MGVFMPPPERLAALLSGIDMPDEASAPPGAEPADPAMAFAGSDPDPERTRWLKEELSLREATRMTGDRYITFPRGGPLFRVPAVPFTAGGELLILQRRLHLLRKDTERKDPAREGGEPDCSDVVQMVRLCADAVTLFRRLVVPASFWRRLLWRWARNPFRACSEREVGYLLDFFSACRGIVRVREM